MRRLGRIRNVAWPWEVETVFADRVEAGRQLALRLMHLKGRDPVVLALPRGGVPVAVEIARALAAPLDLVMVRKLGVPGQPELAAGAVVGGAVELTVLNEGIVRLCAIAPATIEHLKRRELAEIERRRALYYGEWEPIEIAGKCAIIVDDGIATGASMRAALQAVHQAGAAWRVAAAPVAPPDTLDALAGDADEVAVALIEPDFQAIGLFYQDFHQLEDAEVIAMLATVRVPT